MVAKVQLNNLDCVWKPLSCDEDIKLDPAAIDALHETPRSKGNGLSCPLVEWNTRCFDDLVIDDDIKKITQALVSTHTNNLGVDDIIEGKGKGLVCVLREF